MGKPVNPIWDQQDYLFYESNGTTSIGSPATQQSLEVDTTYYIRVAVGDTNNTNQDVGLTINWQYNLAGGGWNEITDTTPIQHANGSLTDGGTLLTSELTAIGTYNTGRVYESENTAAVVYTTPGLLEIDTYTEVMLGFTIDSGQVSSGQEILVRCTLGDGTVLDAYSATPDIDVLEAANLLADDVQSVSEISSPAIAQTHVLLANDITSNSEVTNPALGQIYFVNATATGVGIASETSSVGLLRTGTGTGTTSLTKSVSATRSFTVTGVGTTSETKLVNLTGVTITGVGTVGGTITIPIDEVPEGGGGGTTVNPIFAVMD